MRKAGCQSRRTKEASITKADKEQGIWKIVMAVFLLAGLCHFLVPARAEGGVAKTEPGPDTVRMERLAEKPNKKAIWETIQVKGDTGEKTGEETKKSVQAPAEKDTQDLCAAGEGTYVPEAGAHVETEVLEEPAYTQAELELLAKLLYCEMGCSWIADEEQRKVGSVVLNRVASDQFPNTIQEVIYQPGQYAPAISGLLETTVPDEKALANARWVLENGSILPEEVVFQSTTIQGEIHSSYFDAILGTTTYYCYGPER